MYIIRNYRLATKTPRFQNNRGRVAPTLGIDRVPLMTSFSTKWGLSAVRCKLLPTIACGEMVSVSTMSDRSDRSDGRLARFGPGVGRRARFATDPGCANG